MPAKNTQPKAQQSQPSISTADMLKVLQQLQQEAAREEAAAAAAEAERKQKENAEKTLVFYLNNNAPLLDGDIVIGTVGTLPSMIDGELINNPSEGAGLKCRLAIKREHFVALGGKLKRSASRSGKAQLHGYLQGGRKITAVVQDPFFVEDLQDATGEGVLLQASITEILQSAPHAGGVPVKVTPEQIRLAAEKAKEKSREGLSLWRQSLDPRTIITDTEDTFN